MKYVLKLGDKMVYLVIQKGNNLVKIRWGHGKVKVHPPFKAPEVFACHVD